VLEGLGNRGIQAGKLVRWKKNMFFTCFDQVENIWDAQTENQKSFYKNHIVNWMFANVFYTRRSRIFHFYYGGARPGTRGSMILIKG